MLLYFFEDWTQKTLTATQWKPPQHAAPLQFEPDANPEPKRLSWSHWLGLKSPQLILSYKNGLCVHVSHKHVHRYIYIYLFIYIYILLLHSILCVKIICIDIHSIVIVVLCITDVWHIEHVYGLMISNSHARWTARNTPKNHHREKWTRIGGVAVPVVYHLDRSIANPISTHFLGCLRNPFSCVKREVANLFRRPPPRLRFEPGKKMKDEMGYFWLVIELLIQHLGFRIAIPTSWTKCCHQPVILRRESA